MIKSRTVDQLRSTTFELLREAHQGVEEMPITVDAGMFYIRSKQLELIQELADLMSKISEAKSEELQLQLRRAIARV
jgi:F0F1-type ATP synthase epsilon subunit